MKKQEVIEYIRKEKSFVPFISLFDLYENNDDIPQEFINMVKADYKPNGNFMVCSAELAEQLNNMQYGM